MEEYEVLSKWLEVSYKFDCDSKIESWDIQLSIFTNFLLQANKLTIYDLNNWIENLSPKKYTVLTSKISSTNFDLNKAEIKKKDTDWDWVSDDDEKIYKTNPYEIDSDGDNYSDFEEITTSFDPINKNPWPRQVPRDKIPDDVKNSTQTNLKQEQEYQKAKNSGLAFDFYWIDYLEKALKNINDYVKWNWNWNFLYVFFIVMFLWFIHAFGPWHSKSIMISYILDKNKKFIDALFFALIFSITHIIDIIIVFVIAKFVLSYYDISNYIVYIHRFSILILIFISLYLIYKSIKNLKNNNSETCIKSDTKSNIFLWFLTWLAPCTFGWSIFLLLFSLWNLSLIPILIFALGLGIFITLITVAIITLSIRKRVFEKISLFSKYSQIVSSSLILIVSFYIFYLLF